MSIWQQLERLSPAQRVEAIRQVDQELLRRGYDPYKFVSECLRQERESAIALVDNEDPQERYSKYLLWKPYPVQQDFRDSDIKELAWGGEAGGSKSVGQIMAAERFVEVPHYSAIIFRKVEDDLHKPGSLIPLAHEFFQGTGARWSEKLLTYSFPSGASISFAGMNDKNAHFRYQTSAFQYIGFDELGHWPNDKQYRYMFSRLRKGKRLVDVPLRMRPTFNPGGTGAEWIAARYGLNGDANFVMPTGRGFMISRRSDNTELDEASYLATLEELDVVEKAQLMHGDFTACPIGKYFKEADFKYVSLASVPAGIKLCRGWDTGATENGDATAGALLGVYNRDLYLIDMAYEHAATPRVRELVRETWREDPEYTLLAIENAQCGLSVIQDIEIDPEMGRVPLYPVVANGDKEERSRGWRARLQTGRMYLVRGGWNDRFKDECLKFTNEDTNRDDQIDAVSVAFHAIFKHFGDTDEQKQKHPEGSIGASFRRDDDDD